MARNPSPQWFDGMYNNRTLVPDYARYLSSWAGRSAAARLLPGAHLDIAYGPGDGESLDVFRSRAEPVPNEKASGSGVTKVPVLVFLHGGYWRSLDKADHSFIAPQYTQAGACVVVPNYALCPGSDAHPVTVPHIALQMVKALVWTWRNIDQYGGDPARITVVGHSAGGHLAAMMLACVWKAVAPDLPDDLVRNALSISGLHELESIRRTPFLQVSLRLSPEDAVRASPAWLPAPAQGILNSVCGGDESAEFLRQNRLIQQAWGKRSVPVCASLPGLNHFSILDTFAASGSSLHRLSRRLLQL
ncbi:MAG: alpha/beta hydrolase [Rhodoferax sp.]|nr:alpha/beta hydrolase [Rhodoferax sp.]HQZ08018.1 alpha/beta hydrolase [Burkholderiaceae bacterium]